MHLGASREWAVLAVQSQSAYDLFVGSSLQPPAAFYSGGARKNVSPNFKPESETVGMPATWRRYVSNVRIASIIRGLVGTRSL